MADSDEYLTTKDLLKQGPIDFDAIREAISDPHHPSTFNPEYLKFLEDRGLATIGEMDTPYHYDKEPEEYVQFSDTKGIWGELAYNFTRNKRNDNRFSSWRRNSTR